MLYLLPVPDNFISEIPSHPLSCLLPTLSLFILYLCPSHHYLSPRLLQFPGYLFIYFCPSIIYSLDSLYVNHTMSLLCLRTLMVPHPSPLKQNLSTSPCKNALFASSSALSCGSLLVSILFPAHHLLCHPWTPMTFLAQGFALVSQNALPLFLARLAHSCFWTLSWKTF